MPPTWGLVTWYPEMSVAGSGSVPERIATWISLPVSRSL